MPASKETRFRVEGFWKIRATLRRASASDDVGAVFRAWARASSPVSSARVNSAPVRRWRGKPGSVRWRELSLRVLTWNLLHGRAVPSAGRELFDQFAAA